MNKNKTIKMDEFNFSNKMITYVGTYLVDDDFKFFFFDLGLLSC